MKLRVVLGMLAWALSLDVAAQAFPTKPVRLVSGPGPEAAARILAAALSEAWGQQVITETLPAASGKVAAETVARSAPDGYTLLNATSSFQIARALGVNPVNVATDLAPVALTNLLPFVLVVPAASEPRSVAELIARARSAPGKMNYASGGNGTLPHLAAELFKRLSGADIVHVPYKSADQASLALLASQVDMMFTSYPVVGGQVRAGKLRLLASTPARRPSGLPDAPTIAESGLAGFDLSSWTGVFAPLATPPAQVARLREDVSRALRSPNLRQQYGALGFESVPEELAGARLAQYLADDTAAWTRLVKDSGAKID